jgi:hypothetical protein
MQVKEDSFVVRETERYKGKEIAFEIPADESKIGEVRLEIEGKHVHAIRMEDGKYGSHVLPYSDYDSIIDLAKALIDNVPEFGGGLSK